MSLLSPLLRSDCALLPTHVLVLKLELASHLDLLEDTHLLGFLEKAFDW